YGRAYDASEIVGDSGAAGKFELRFTEESASGFGFTAYAFYEGGKVWRRLDASETDTPKDESATSAGGGVRITLGSHVSGYIEGAVPLDRDVAAEGNRDARFFGGIKVSLGR